MRSAVRSPARVAAVSLPVVFGLILLGGGASAAADEGAWLPYALAALAGAAVPLAYTLRLMHERRLFLRDNVAARRRVRASTLIPLGCLLGVGLLVVSAALGQSAKIVFYAVVGRATIGFSPGLLANFIRLWREEWHATAAASDRSASRRVPSKSR